MRQKFFTTNTNVVVKRKLENDMDEVIVDPEPNYLLTLPEELLVRILGDEHNTLLNNKDRMHFSWTNPHNHNFINRNYGKTLYAKVLRFSKFMDDNLSDLVKDIDILKSKRQRIPYRNIIKDIIINFSAPMTLAAFSYNVFPSLLTMWIFYIAIACCLLYFSGAAIWVYRANNQLSEYPMLSKAYKFLFNLLENNFLLEKLFLKENVENLLPRNLLSLVYLERLEQNIYSQITLRDINNYAEQNKKIILLTRQQINRYQVNFDSRQIKNDEPQLPINNIKARGIYNILDDHISVIKELLSAVKDHHYFLLGAKFRTVDFSKIKINNTEHRNLLNHFFDKWNESHKGDVISYMNSFNR